MQSQPPVIEDKPAPQDVPATAPQGEATVAALRTPALKQIILGGLVASLALLGQTDVLSNISGPFNDKDIMARWSSVLSGATRQAIPITIIDIDDATIARVGATDRTPRDLVAAFANLAAEKNAAAIFLDLDTSKPGPDRAGDMALIGAVAAWPPDAPPLMFARRFVDAPDKQPATELGLAPLPSILDAPAAGRANVLSVSSAAPLDGDRVIRRWQLSQTICEGAKGMSYASPQLVALALQERGAQARASVDAFLAWRDAQTCRGSSAPAPAWPRNPDMSASIWFLFGADLSQAPITMIESGGRQTPLVRHIAGHTLVGADGGVARARAVADDVFAGRIVVIGSSHLDSFDTHMTPLGPMSGAFIVANAVAGAPATLSAMRIPSLVRTLAAMAIFVLLAWLTRNLRAMAAAIVVVAVMIVLLAVLGRFMAPSNALTITVTSTALLALFSGLNSIYEIGHAWRQVGWRAVLKPAPHKPAPAKSELS